MAQGENVLKTRALSYAQTQIRVRRNLMIQSKLSNAGEKEVLNVPGVLGPVGGGKSAMAMAEAESFELPLKAINNGENADPTDVSGVPMPMMIRKLMTEGTVGEQKEAKGEYMAWVLNRYAAEACQGGVFLFFDDIDKAEPPVQGALLGIIGNRMFRDQHIHPHTLIMCAGNRTEDDTYAHQLSESLRTRITVIEMEPDVVSFCDYGTRTGRIHPVVMGFLQYKPDYLHRYLEGTSRFPTPRGWREVTVHFEEAPDPFEDVYGNNAKDNWRAIVAEKCGDPVSKDFWGWYKIIRQIDVKRLLQIGKIDQVLKTDDGKPAEKRMAEFAAIFALAQELNIRGVKKEYVGLDMLFDDKNPDGISKELRIALAVQLKRNVRADVAKMFPKAANSIMSILVPSGSP